jgi:surface carbohydrate biosynthesis protein
MRLGDPFDRRQEARPNAWDDTISRTLHAKDGDMATASLSKAVEKARFPWRDSQTAATGPRVAIVVDHPLRDLPGMVLLAGRLASRGLAVYLVPYNLAEVELWRLTPDFVLVNYFRKNAASLYEKLFAANVQVGVLDTEGGVIESLDVYKDELVPDAALRDQVACFCTWGPRLASYVTEQRLFNTGQVHVTGCPRFDYYASPWRQAALANSKYVEPYAKNLILLNANFSLGNPAFLTRQQQFELMVQSLEHDAEKIRGWQQREVEGMRGLANLANRLARAFPNATVVYRPHPFERMETYDGLLKHISNLHCLRTGSMDGWLMRAKVVVQRSCSTSIEASMNGVSALSPNWLPTSFERPAANDTSVGCDNEGKLLDRVGDVLAGRHRQPETVRSAAEHVLADWFGPIDGDAHNRVADAILSCINDEGRDERVDRCRRLAYSLGGKRFSKKWLRGMLLSALDAPPNRQLLGGRLKPIDLGRFEKWQSSAKYFDVHQTLRLTNALADCHDESTAGAKAICASPARPGRDYQFHYTQGRSIRIGVQ